MDVDENDINKISTDVFDEQTQEDNKKDEEVSDDSVTRKDNQPQDQEISDETLHEIHDLNNGTASGYIHNVSPLKKDNYFDFQLQMKSKTVRGVCFTPEKRKRFEACSSVDKPVTIKKFRLETKSNSEDILIDEGSEIEDCSKINFAKEPIPTNFTIATLKSVCIGQLVSIKAKVASLQTVREVKNGALKLAEAILIDPTDSIKITIWEDHIGNIEEGKTYHFNNIRVKKNTFSNEVYVNTAKGETTTICITNDFEEQLSLPLNDYTNKTVLGEILSINRVTMYNSCFRCHKKVDVVQHQKFVECKNCNVAQKVKACKKEWVVHFTFIHDNSKVDLTMFSNVVALVLKQQHILERCVTSPDDLKAILFDLADNLQITFNKNTKVVSNIVPK